MAVNYTHIRPEPLLSPSLVILRDNLLNALVAFEAAFTPPLEKGYENRLRNFVFRELHHTVPALWRLFNGGAHIYYDGHRYYQADLLIGEPGILLPNQLSFNFRRTRHILQDIIEWGHDHARSVKGCVNKPFADFTKWFILFDGSGRFHYNPLPICCFQIATDVTGNEAASVARIEHVFSSMNFLTDKWEIDYDHHPAHAYVFMNYFPVGSNFHSLLAALTNQFYAADLSAHYNRYYIDGNGWPFELSDDHGVNALDAILNL